MTGWTSASIPSQAGRVAIVTGATSGLGYEAALALAKASAHVVLAARDANKADRAMATIRQAAPGAQIEFRRLDTASLAAVREFAVVWASKSLPIDILILNAGISTVPTREETVDGFERQLGTNYLGHFALTGLLLPHIARRSGSRIVEVASLAHARTHLHLDDLQLKASYSPMVGYSQSKLAMLTFGLELDRRLQAVGSPIASIPAHPGVAGTDITRRGGRAGWFQRWFGTTMFRLVGQSPAHGAWPLLFAATSPDARRGTYYGPNGSGERRGSPAPARVAPQAEDRAVVVKLWAMSEELTGTTYEFGSS